MREQDTKALSSYRIAKARQCLSSACKAQADSDYETAANRSYYAIFHAIRALLALDEVDYKKHSAVISKFREIYIKGGIFPRELSDIVGNAFELRADTDYEDFYVVEKAEVDEQLVGASRLVEEIIKHLNLR